jgi:hypothetical protein
VSSCAMLWFLSLGLLAGVVQIERPDHAPHGDGGVAVPDPEDDLALTPCAAEPPATPARRDNTRSVSSYPPAIAIPRSAPKIALGPGTGIANRRQPIPMSAPRKSPTNSFIGVLRSFAIAIPASRTPGYFLAPAFRSCLSQSMATPVPPAWAIDTSAKALTVSPRAQSRCHSVITPIQVSGVAPA